MDGAILVNAIAVDRLAEVVATFAAAPSNAMGTVSEAVAVDALTVKAERSIWVVRLLLLDAPAIIEELSGICVSRFALAVLFAIALPIISAGLSITPVTTTLP